MGPTWQWPGQGKLVSRVETFAGGGGGGGELGQRVCQDENTLLEGYWNVGGAGGSKPERGRLWSVPAEASLEAEEVGTRRNRELLAVVLSAKIELALEQDSRE